MAARKTVKPGHVVESDTAPAAENATALDDLQEPDSVYEPDMVPLAKADSPESSPSEPQASVVASEAEGPADNTPKDADATGDDLEPLRLVILRSGATFRFRNRVFKQGEPTAVDEEIAERLARSGFFDRG